jgi:apolipoprotein D and lipocalin family protein
MGGFMKKYVGLLLLMLAGCVKIPPGVEPIANFDAQRYMGQWYEVARLDHRFERGLSEVTAYYELKPNGKILVTNRGWNASKQKWQQAQGRAYQVGESGNGLLKVSFFGPFFGAYVIAELDTLSYQYSLVTGPNHSYMWILARNPVLEDEVRTMLLARAKAMGFKVEDLIWVEHGDHTVPREH